MCCITWFTSRSAYGALQPTAAIGAAKLYGKSVAVIYGVLVVMGLIPGMNTTLGLIPLYGHDIWLHAALALVAAYFGFRSEEGHTATGGATTGRL